MQKYTLDTSDQKMITGNRVIIGSNAVVFIEAKMGNFVCLSLLSTHY